MNSCPSCDRTWTGDTECHCASCHHQFASLEAFDAHWPLDVAATCHGRALTGWQEPDWRAPDRRMVLTYQNGVWSRKRGPYQGARAR